MILVRNKTEAREAAIVTEVPEGVDVPISLSNTQESLRTLERSVPLNLYWFHAGEKAVYCNNERTFLYNSIVRSLAVNPIQSSNFIDIDKIDSLGFEDLREAFSPQAMNILMFEDNGDESTLDKFLYICENQKSIFNVYAILDSTGRLIKGLKDHRNQRRQDLISCGLAHFVFSPEQLTLNHPQGLVTGLQSQINALEMLKRKLQTIPKLDEKPEAKRLEDELNFGVLKIEEFNMVNIRNKTVGLTPIESGLLQYLANNKGRAISKEELLKQVWEHQNTSGGYNSVEVAVRRLRQKLEIDPSDPKIIITIRGFGYRFNWGNVGPNRGNIYNRDREKQIDRKA